METADPQIPPPHAGGPPPAGLDRDWSLLESLAVGVLVQGPAAEIVFANRAALEMLGLEAAEVIGRSTLDAADLVLREDGTPYPPQDHPGARALATGRPVREAVMGVYRARLKDRVWLLVNADPELAPAGEVRRVVCTFVDVTRFKAAERRLQESEARYRQLVEKAQDIIYGTDVNGFFTYVNAAASRLMGYPAAELVGRHFTELVREDHRQRVAAQLVDQFRRRLPATYDEFPVLPRDGHELWIGQNVQLLAHGGRVEGFQAIARDITGRKRAERALEQDARRAAPAADIAPAAPRILVAEDDPINRKVVLAMLDNLGYRAHAVGDGLEAVEECSRGGYDLVLMDCMMPEMDGYRATAWIRQREAGRPRTPVIALTASTAPGDREKCFAAGMDAYLSKPITLRALEEALRRWARPGAPATGGEAGAAPPSALPASHPLRVLEGQGRREAVIEIIGLFLDTTPLRIERLRETARGGDLAALLSVAHSLRGAALQLGSARMAELCVEAQAAARAGETGRLDALLAALQAEFRELAPALEAERDRLAGPSAR